MTTRPSGDKRTTTTFLDPKLLPVIIPMTLAIGSGFLMHDRTLSEITTKVDTYTTRIAEHTNNIREINQLVSKTAVLETRLSRVEVNQAELEKLETTLNQVVGTLTQQQVFSSSQLNVLQQRVREVERAIDRLPSR